MTITQKMQSPWYFTELRHCNITLEELKPIRGYFPESKTFGHSLMKKLNAPLPTLSVCTPSKFLPTAFSKVTVIFFRSKKPNTGSLTQQPSKPA
ncbi:hypothetical protein [Bartonella sp. MR110HLJHH]|uniref:hypothetical protein n=1 Tax=Bartonella sp. MR110HLJHH TaxID=3243555 RepID=UPI0035CEDD4E